MLSDDEWSQWTNVKNGRMAGVSDRFVNGLRASANGSQTGRKVERAGATYTMNVTGLQKAERERIKEQADAIREVEHAERVEKREAKLA